MCTKTKKCAQKRVHGDSRECIPNKNALEIEFDRLSNVLITELVSETF